MSNITLNITGMHCESCKSLIEEVCGEVQGVKSCVVDPAQGTAVVEHDGSVTVQSLQTAISALGGYTAEPKDV